MWIQQISARFFLQFWMKKKDFDLFNRIWPNFSKDHFIHKIETKKYLMENKTGDEENQNTQFTNE